MIDKIKKEHQKLKNIRSSFEFGYIQDAIIQLEALLQQRQVRKEARQKRLNKM